MTLFLAALAILIAGGMCALLSGTSSIRATRFGVGSAILGSALGAGPAVAVLLGSASLSLRLPWDVPYGAFSVEIDPLSAVFLLIVFGISAPAALYGGEYLGRAPHRTDEDRPRRLGPPWFFYNLLVASMALVVVARNGMLFLTAWEVMAITSFFLVTLEDHEPSVRDAGRTYLIATHLATAFLLLLFTMLGRRAGSLDFDRLAAAGPLEPALAGMLLVLGVIGFGSKAGLVPFHIWLPEAHPAAPSHVSAVMSGAMITMGVYGLLRLLTFLGPPELWWGGLLVGIGLLSAVFGALLAMAQHDLKRLLAYSTVENAGIITTGIGIGVIGASAGAPVVAILGFTGALLHTLNHMLFKGLLFLGAGAVALETGTRTLDRMGGLLRRMPFTGAGFLVGALAGAALPPLNGFASEFLVVLASLGAGTTLGVAASLPALAAVAALALVGGLAAAAMTKAFGIAFLGQPRTGDADAAREPGGAMRFALGSLAVGVVVSGIASPWLAAVTARAVAPLLGLPPSEASALVLVAARPLGHAVLAALFLLALIAGLALLRRALLSRRQVEESVTWDCGYATPTARMQYTGSSFVRPLVLLFRGVLRTRRVLTPSRGLYPGDVSLVSETPDVIGERVIYPVFRGAGRGFSRLRWLQHGRLNLYMLYVALTLLVLLVWKLG